MENFTLWIKNVFIAFFVFSTQAVFAQTFTAANSGAWSDASTWQGGTAPSFTVGALQSVVIPSGIDVTLENTVIVDGLLAALQVEGSLTSPNENGSLVFNLGTVSGDGTITLDDVIFNGGTFSFTGSINANSVTSATGVQLAADLMVNEMFTLSSGSFSVVTDGFFDVAQDAIIIINSGNLSLNNGGVGLTNAYDVKYSQGSSTSGFEANGTGLRDLTIDVGNANAVTFSNDLDIDGTLHIQSGTMILNGNDLTVNGSISSTSNGSIQSTDESDINLNTTNGTVGTLTFTATGNNVSDFTINVGDGNWVTLGSDLNIHGTLMFMSGGINADDNDITIEPGGTFGGADSTSYIITGAGGALIMRIPSGGPSFTYFPVGTSEHYLPTGIQLNSTSSSAMMRVGVNSGVMSQGTSGNNWATDSTLVNATWFIEPSVPSTTIDANIQLLWRGGMEVNGFDRNHAYVGHYTSGSWMMEGNPMAATQTSGLWSIQANNITEFSPFAVFQAAPSSIDELEAGINMNIFPNPTAQRININFSEDMLGTFNMEIVDMYGKVVDNYKLTGNGNSIDISHLPSGNYFIRFSNSDFRTVRKVVKL